MIRLKRLFANNFKQLQEVELRFPDHARVLVQGKNEAGKSTLFEAVFFALFGSALATESGARNLDDLIRYDFEKARVELDVQFGAREFRIKRTIVRGKTNVWELDIAHNENSVDEIRGNTAVNKRLIAELGFDGDALLNTCFVEQKKLEKLEGLSKAKREESLSRLLNLDALIQIESDLKITAEDKRDLDRMKKRADLAAIQAELPVFQDRLAKTEEGLRLIDLRGAVDGAVSEMQTVQQLHAQIQSLAAKRDQASQRVERIESLKEAMLSVKTARDTAERATEIAREIERLKTEQAEAQRVTEQAPLLQERITALHRLEKRTRRLDQVQLAEDEYSKRTAQLTLAQERVEELTATVMREEDALAQGQARLHELTLAGALSDWISARRLASPSEVTADVEAKQQALTQLGRRFRSEMLGYGALCLILAVAAALIPAVTIALTGATAIVPALLLASALFALALLGGAVLGVRGTRLWHSLSQAAEGLGQAQGEARLRAAEGEAHLARLKEAEEKLNQLGMDIPESVDIAQSKRDAIFEEKDGSGKGMDELRAEQDAGRERLLHAHAVLAELLRQHSLDESTNLREEIGRTQLSASKAHRILSSRQMQLQQAAQSLAVMPESTTLQRARFQLEAEAQQLQRQKNEAARLSQEIARREQQAQTLLGQTRAAYDKARATQPDAAEWKPSLAVDYYNAFGKELRAAYDLLGGESVVKETREIEGELGRRQGERATRAHNVELLTARIQEILGASNRLSSPPKLPELEELRERLQGLALGDEATLRAEHRDLVGRVHSLNDRQAQLEGELGLVGQALDRATSQIEWEQKVRESRVRERGVEIASLTRRHIMHKILPATMDYMRQILPALTHERYHDAQLDPETYKIQVWDERAGGSAAGQGSNGTRQSGAFKEKNIFSGGTRDQFSLALRLAFALATLPQERGASPSFIFLDEPLSSFDDERAEALIYLLTEGDIARAFDQIFLISHVHVNERLFTHRVMLENGQVAATDL